MKEITVKTQAQLDKLPDSFKEYTVIKIESTKRIYVRTRPSRNSNHIRNRVIPTQRNL